MIKFRVTYKDLNGENTTEDNFFSLNTREMTMINAEYGMNLELAVANMVRARNFKGLINLLDSIVIKSYGVQSIDNKRFDKSESLSKEFENSLFYASMFEKLFQSPSMMLEFVKGVSSKEGPQKVVTIDSDTFKGDDEAAVKSVALTNE